MRKLLDRLNQIDKHGDSPIDIAVAVITFLACLYLIASLPTYYPPPQKASPSACGLAPVVWLLGDAGCRQKDYFSGCLNNDSSFSRAIRAFPRLPTPDPNF